jgi:hypothetical protein
MFPGTKIGMDLEARVRPSLAQFSATQHEVVYKSSTNYLQRIYGHHPELGIRLVPENTHPVFKPSVQLYVYSGSCSTKSHTSRLKIFGDKPGWGPNDYGYYQTISHR